MRSSLRAIIDIHAGVEQGHREREPGARIRGEGEVGVEDAEPLHRGVAQGHRLLRVRAADIEPHLLEDLDPGPCDLVLASFDRIYLQHRQ